MKAIIGFNLPATEIDPKKEETVKRQSRNFGIGFAFTRSDFWRFKGMPGKDIQEIEKENQSHN